MTDISLRAVRKTACPSCGAEVPIHTRAAMQAVCPYCRSTLVRSDLKWEDVGKMAALADDLTPVRLGMQGRWGDQGFTVIGRLQKQHPDGVWNEWLLMLDNNQRAWLGEGSGLYYWTEPTTLIEPLPDFASLRAGMTLKINNKRWTITDVEPATCIACEGELPFRLPPGSNANAADAMAENGEFASLDYGDDPPSLYTGRVVNLEDLHLQGVEDAAPATRASGELRCAKCGSAMARHIPGSVSIACAHCATVHNQTPRGKLLIAFEQALYDMKPKLALGARGRLEDAEFEIVGWQHRMAASDFWDEYLLYNPQKGLRWLVEGNGHWTWTRSIAAAKDNGLSATFESIGYKHFATYTATTVAVLGEFNWRLKKDEKWQVRDFIKPPAILCREHGDREVTWSLGTYLPRATVAEAFDNQDLPTPSGVAANEPGVAIGPLFKAYLLTLVLAAILGPIARGTLVPHAQAIGGVMLPAAAGSTQFVSEPFTLTNRQGVLRINADTNVANHWMELDYTLVRQDGGDTREASREIGYYWGTDSDGSWSEGSQSGSVDISSVPAGTYVLTVEADSPPMAQNGPRGDLTATISVQHGVGTGNFWWLLSMLGIGPLLGAIAWYFHEKWRWENSDHPWSNE